MKIRIYENYDTMSQAAAEIIMQIVQEKPDAVFCMPGGSSVIGMYRYLVEQYQNGKVNFSHMYALDMDSYLGLPQFDKNNYSYFNNIHFLDHVNVSRKRRFMPDSMAEDPEQEARRYAKLIQSLGGIDISATGIGDDGHICFDEPSDYLLPQYHVATLHDETRIANSRFFDTLSQVPDRSFTLGLEEIMSCKTFLVLASGKHKAVVLQKLFAEEKIWTQYPVSFLRMHSNCIFLLDKDAASLIPDKAFLDYDFEICST